MDLFNQPRPSDVDALALVAEAMKVSEYQLFVEAYRAWHGEEPEERQLNRLFGKYLRRGELPAFVRHFARHYLASHPEFLATRRAQQHKMLRAQHLSLLLIAVMVLAALLLF